MTLEEAWQRFFQDPEGPMPAELQEALERVDRTDYIEERIAAVGREGMSSPNLLIRPLDTDRDPPDETGRTTVNVAESLTPKKPQKTREIP
jgi:hypothetical protein